MVVGFERGQLRAALSSHGCFLQFPKRLWHWAQLSLNHSPRAKGASFNTRTDTAQPRGSGLLGHSPQNWGIICCLIQTRLLLEVREVGVENKINCPCLQGILGYPIKPQSGHCVYQ